MKPIKSQTLSEALRRSFANRELYGAESKDPGDTSWQMLLEAFRPQTTTQDKKSRMTILPEFRRKRPKERSLTGLSLKTIPYKSDLHKTSLDLLLLFSYISPHARSALPQVLRGLLQEVRPRRISRNRQLPCHLDICGVLPMRGEAEVSALRGDPWQAPFRGSQKESPSRSHRWAAGTRSGPPQSTPGRAIGGRPLIISAGAPV